MSCADVAAAMLVLQRKGAEASRHAEAATAAGEFDTAIRWARMAAELVPDHLGFRLQWALSLRRAGLEQQAWHVMAAIAVDDTDEPALAERLRIARGWCASKLGDAADARGQCDTAAAWHARSADLLPEHPACRLAWARSLIQGGHAREAWPILADPKWQDHDAPETHSRLRALQAACARQIAADAAARGAHDEVVAWLRRAAEAEPDNAEWRLGLAGALMNATRFAEAWRLLLDVASGTAGDVAVGERVRRMQAACANSYAWHIELGAGPLSIEGVDWGEAVVWRREMTRRTPSSLLAWYRYVLALVLAGRFAAAAAVVERPPSPEIGAMLRAWVGAMPEHLQAQAEAAGFVYRSAASRYLARGLPVVPAFGKVVIPGGWERWARAMPPEREVRRWCEIGHAGIGLVLGPQAGVSMIDIDTDDPALIAAIRAALPPSPWVRIGRRGMALAYRWTDQPSLGFITAGDIATPVVDVLSTGTHIVLPPSLHPQTGKPYAANVELLDVLDDLVTLPDDVGDRLQAALRAAGCDAERQGKPGG
jgi:tetratricopeptide (TPR) repeat protein